MSTAMPTRHSVRLPADAEQAARERWPELATAPVAVLLRAALLVLGGEDPPAAIRQARRKRGRPPRRPVAET